METTYHTAKVGGRYTFVDPEKVVPEAVQVWHFEHREITGEDEIEAGRRVAQDGILGSTGTGEEATILLHKGFTLLERQLTGWNQEKDGAKLPVNAANVRALVPSVVARRFALEQLFGRVASPEELEAIKKKPTPPTPSGDEQAPSE